MKWFNVKRSNTQTELFYACSYLPKEFSIYFDSFDNSDYKKRILFRSLIVIIYA